MASAPAPAAPVNPLQSLKDGDILQFSDDLLRQHALWAAKDERGACVLHWCAWHGFRDLAREWLASFPGLVDVPAMDGQTPLMWAIRRGDTPTSLLVLHQLIEAGADVNARDAKEATPFLLACQFGHKRAAAALLLRGAHSNVVDAKGHSPAHWAAYTGRLDLLHLLRAHAPLDLTVADAAGVTPLGRAVQQGHLECVKFILDYPHNRHHVDSYAKVDGQQDALSLANSLKLADTSRRNSQGKGQAGVSRPRRTPKIPPQPLYLRWLPWLLHVPAFNPLDSRVSCVMDFIFSPMFPRIDTFGWCTLPIAVALMAFIMRCDPARVATAGAQLSLRTRLLSGVDAPDADDICFTCLVEKPLRSKHCSMCNCCVRRFDHHCTWMANCVGENNNRQFVALIFLQFVAHVLFVFLCAMAAIYGDMFASPLSGLGFVLNALLQIFGLGFTGMLLRQHADLVLRNYTSNESINWHKYSWFQKSDGEGDIEFHNPFDHSPWANLREFWTRPPASLMRVYQKSGAFRVVPRV